MNSLLELGNWPIWVMGWPAITLSIVCAAAGLVLRSNRFMVAGAVIAMPFCWYLAMNPGIWRFIAPVIAFLYFIGAFALSRGQRGFALILLLPFVMVAAWLATQLGRH